MSTLELKDLRIQVNNEYVGFSPDGDSIKPIHVAGGVFRVVFGATLDTKKIKQIGFVVSKKGIVPKGSSDEDVAALIDSLNCFDETPDVEELRSFRTILQKMLGTDDGLYPDNSQLTFSTGSKYFIKTKAQYEDAGEFIGGVIKEYCPTLSTYIYNVLNAANDPISVLLKPFADETEVTQLNDSDLRHKSISAFKNKSNSMKWYLDGIRKSGDCLKNNLEKMPNVLTQLRLFIFFCIFHLIRYMSLLESFYCKGPVLPFLFEFGDDPNSGIKAASTSSYARVHQSISRFYSWAFAMKLIDLGKTREGMLSEETPVYDRNKTAKDQNELDSQWELAKENAKKADSDSSAMLEYGKTIYNMSSMQSSSYPVTFLRILGAQAGIVWPTIRESKRKRFHLSQDTFEMVIRSCVDRSETISYEDLCSRMLERFNIVVSGIPSSIDPRIIGIQSETGLDSDVLEDNHQKCVNVLEAMDFADLMADGILRVHLGGNN